MVVADFEAATFPPAAGFAVDADTAATAGLVVAGTAATLILLLVAGTATPGLAAAVSSLGAGVEVFPVVFFAAATFGASVGTTTGLDVAVCALTAGVKVFAGAPFAIPAEVCRVNTNSLPGPGINS